MAIAFDATTTSSLGSAVTSITFSHTCTGSNRILFVCTANNGGANVTGVTYNGVAMTNIWGALSNGAPSKSYLWYLIAPATGANNVVVSLSASVSVIAKVVSYTWASQTWQPDSNSSNWPTTTTSFTASTTTVADNSWLIMCGMGRNANAITAGANTTIRSPIEALLAWLFVLDSNSAQTPAGSKSMNVTSASQEFTGIMASFSPSIASTSNPALLFFL